MFCPIRPVTEQKAVGRSGVRPTESGKAVFDAIADEGRAVVAHWARGALVFGLVSPETLDVRAKDPEVRFSR